MDIVEASKSPNDKKQYRLLELPNKLQVLLISAPSDSSKQNGMIDDDMDEEMEAYNSEDDEDDDDLGDEENEHDSVFGEVDDDQGPPSRRAGACLTVGVGSFAEPEGFPGLAHYLEHMLFMGSEKYPDENEFEAYLSAHGGFSNGATDNEVTSYTFEVGPAHLEKSLDMFANFFVSPLMKENAMERELSAIESEFSQAAQNDRVRLQQVISHNTPPTHPYSRFGWGNRKSLKEIPEEKKLNVRETILEFYEKYYSANIMKLVVCGEDPLDEMEKWVTSSFSKIKNKDIEPPSFASFGRPFGIGIDSKPLLCRIIPVRDIHTLHISWPIPPVFGLHHQKPHDYIASLIGHESEGSVLSSLKSNGWVSSLTAGVTDSDGHECGTFGAKFDMSMKLTVEGVGKWEEIIEAMFQYLRMVHESGLPEWIFEEIKALADISFRFQEENSAVENCEELASIMQQRVGVAPKDILRYELFQGEFDRKLVKDILEWLTPDNIRVNIISQLFSEDTEFQTQAIDEPWFGAKYSKCHITHETLLRWRNVQLNERFHLPKQNPFIPRNFKLLCDPSTGMSSVLQIPAIIHSSAMGKVWFKQDDVFGTPRANVGFFIHLPSICQHAGHHALGVLYSRLVKDSLTEYAYYANVAELMYSIRVKESGIELFFGGFNDKLLLLVEVVMNSLFSNGFIPARFDVMKEDLLREYRNAVIKAGVKGKYLRGQLLDQAAFRLEDGIKALEQATPEILRIFLTTTLWSSKTFYHALAHGNISSGVAMDIAKMLEGKLLLVSAPIDETQLPLRLIRILPVSSNGILIQEPSEHMEDKNTLVDIYFQIGPMSLELLAYAELLHQLMSEPLFDTLRTKQELGYEVSCTVHITHGILGFSVKVQSSDFAPDYLSLCIDRFLIEFAEAIDSMSDEHFKDHVNALNMKKLEPEHNLLELSQRMWVEISSRRFEFEINTKVVEVLKSCTKNGMLDFYKRWVLGTDQSAGVRKLYVHVVGRGSPMKMASETILENPPIPIANLDVYKAQLASFPESVALTN